MPSLCVELWGMPRNWNPIPYIRMYHAYWREYIAISTGKEMHIPAPHYLYYFLAIVIPNCFLGILVQREIIANASLMVSGFLPRTECKDKHFN